jgi:uncharacterized protein YndB with AHSA1/START domain
MIINILIAIAVIVVVFVIVVALQPAEFHVTRTAIISAPAATVFAQVNDLHLWEAWSPWAKLDPEAKTTYAGPATGVGAGFHWAGNHKIGEGTMTITESRPGELVRFKLEFLKPFQGTNTAEFTFKSGDGRTTVTWSMSGKNNFMGKAMGLVMNCDKMVGGQFEKGLADLRSVAEAAA